ncbi:MAG TPA: MFS transporter [Solirubrobacteraceae bacterium]|nr:MFS transporter [Solirubrobacteraceae bacterium]
MQDRRRDLIVAVLALAGAVFAVLQAAVVPALPDIDRALHAGPSSGTWILTVNLLATAVLTPVLGRMGDIHGKDRMLRVVVTTLGLGTLACALAPSLPVMLVGRAVQGAGGAVFPLAFGVLRDELDGKRVAGAIGLVSSLLGIGAGLGLVIAGPVITTLGWRWLFWLPLAVLVPVAAAIARCVPASPVRTPGHLDVPSGVLMVAGLSALLVAVSEASVWGLGSVRTLGLLGGGALLVAMWVRRELASSDPLVDMRMMALRGVWTTNLAAFLLGVGMYASIALVPALVELPRATGVGFGGSVTAAGLFMLPTAAPQLLVGALIGRIARRIDSRAQLFAGVALMLAAYLALTLAHRHAWQLVAATSALGLGLGFGLGALANLIVVAVGPQQTGVATAMNTVMRTLGGAFGAAIAAECLARGGSLDGDFSLAFALCAGALTLGLGAVLAIPGQGLRFDLRVRRGRAALSQS